MNDVGGAEMVAVDHRDFPLFTGSPEQIAALWQRHNRMKALDKNWLWRRYDAVLPFEIGVMPSEEQARFSSLEALCITDLNSEQYMSLREQLPSTFADLDRVLTQLGLKISEILVSKRHGGPNAKLDNRITRRPHVDSGMQILISDHPTTDCYRGRAQLLKEGWIKTRDSRSNTWVSARSCAMIFLPYDTVHRSPLFTKVETRTFMRISTVPLADMG